MGSADHEERFANCLFVSGIIRIVRPGKVDLQFIVRAFPKLHAGGRSFFIIVLALFM